MRDIPDYDWPKAEADAVKRLWEGGADAYMQRRVVQHLVEMLCGTNRISLTPGEPDLTAFNEGRRWVARQVQNAITIPLDKLVKEEPNEPRPDRIPTATERHSAALAGRPASPARRNRTKQPA